MHSSPDRRRDRLALLALAFLAGALPYARAEAPAPPAGTMAFVGATVWDGTGAPPIADATVVIEGGRIKAVTPRSKAKLPRGTRIVDVAGRFIVPGLVDAHVHFFQSGGLYTRPDAVDLNAIRPYAHELATIKADLDDTFRRYLVHGVTAVVDVGGPMWNFDVRKRAGETRLAPRAAVTGPLISTVARPQLDLGDPPIVRAASPDEARALVRAQLPRAPALVKVWFVMTPDRSFDDMLAVARAAIDEAHKGGVRAAVHATDLRAARAAVEAGADVLVHSVTDVEADDAFLQLLKRRGVILIPTLVVMEGYLKALGEGGKSPSAIEARYGAPRAIASWREWPRVAGDKQRAGAEKRSKRISAEKQVAFANLPRVAAAGVTIAAGTDAGNIGTLPGASMHEELEAMVRAGMSPRDVLISATRDAARVFAAKPEIGTLQPGKLADLLVLDGDPLADIANLRRLRLVVRGGDAIAPDEILPPNAAWVVDRQLDAYQARDIDAFLATYAPEIVLYDGPGGPPKMTGKDEMRARYGKVFAGNPRLHATIVDREVSGDFVVDHELISGNDARPYFHGIAIYEVKGGLIRRVWFLGNED